MWFLLFHFDQEEPCSRPGDPDIALQSTLPRCLLSLTSNEMPNSQLCPDISGYTEVRGIENQSNRISTGVFSVQTAAKDAYSSHKPTEPNTIPGRLVFSASDSDSTYGRSSGVSVAAAYVLMIIKE